VGGHFVIWSVYYLSGQNHYLSNNGIETLLNDQHTEHNNINFHHHDCVLLEGFDQFKQLINRWSSTDFDINCYAVRANFAKTFHSLFGTDVCQATPDQIVQAELELTRDADRMIEFVQDSQYPLIFLKSDPVDKYSIFYNDRYPLDLHAQPTTMSEKLKEFQQSYYPGMELKFDNTVWDRREQLALMLLSFVRKDLSPAIDRTRPHLCYGTDDIWNDFDRVVPELLEHCGQRLDQTRWASWLNIYHIWRAKHDPFMSRNLDEILEAVVKNQYMSLKRYNLDFYKEAVIQSELIRRYNLNLKNWQLEKFPSNTQDLHALLEANIHTI
jgi:hypothetical protein